MSPAVTVPGQGRVAHRWIAAMTLRTLSIPADLGGYTLTSLRRWLHRRLTHFSGLMRNKE
ncbi:unnamed protein product [Fusarium graminearum]|nr:unnamed protein product [Fusarium graminearum]CAG1987791.1 unnamed protein product [Fusarium graminearum]CAG1989856.1 unnamed protein product [Fusarium graminearum]VTO89208.1 unnamed protein product [Fusarium graminearum]